MGFELLTFKKDITVFGLYTMYYYEHGKDFYFSGERHDFWEMVYVDSGEVSAVAETTGYLVRQGEAIFHKPMEFHALASNKKDPHNIIVITFGAEGEAMRFFENRILTVNTHQKKILSALLTELKYTFGDIGNIVKYKHRLQEESTEPGAQQMVINYLEQFLIDLIRSNRENEKRQGRKSSHAKKNVENATAEAVEKYLAEQLYFKLTLDDVAKQFHVGKSYLSEIFKTATEKSIMSYYLDLKIAEAKRLLRKGELNFTQIAEKLCYSSVHNFSRIFKIKTSLSPREYQNSVR